MGGVSLDPAVVERGRRSVARLLLRELSLGAVHGIVFPRELMLLARALVTTEATAAIIEPQLSLAEIARPFLPELRRDLLAGFLIARARGRRR